MIAGTQRSPTVQRDGGIGWSSSRHPQKNRLHVDGAAHQSRTIDVALLGCGVVGSQVARYLVEQRDRLARRTGIDVRLKCILVRDRTRERGIDRTLFTDRFEDVLRSDADVVIEALGGLDPACTYVEHLLSNGIDVITANKTLVAHRGADLQAVSARNGSRLAFEAAVCAAIPVLNAIERLRGDHVRSITGILNGTCNFILTRMSEDGLELEQALEEARLLGFAEPDPAADLSGRDSAEKLAVLVSASGAARLSPAEICAHGIEHITQRDIQAAKRLGCVIKLIANAVITDGAIRANVCPTIVSRHHPLASVRLQNNAVVVDSENAGSLFLHGQGAGPQPTAAAIVGDLIQSRSYSKEALAQPIDVSDTPAIGEVIERWFVRLTPDLSVKNPDRLLAALQSHGLAIREIEYAPGEILLLTEPATYSIVVTAVRAVSSGDGLAPFIAIDRRSRASDDTLERAASTRLNPAKGD
jgi:homoserine dehydrogenase